MTALSKILDRMRREPANVRFSDLRKVLLAIDKLEAMRNER
ncbi:MAG: hypothetical protein BroJett006_21180 [Betaproteobacteria bacterium]|jgi:hypothetical protein|nr:MAG: hypothetical protein BroJett006_21180 [Betaproteobacteria bacterium]